jgi:hypothetical protein
MAIHVPGNGHLWMTKAMFLSKDTAEAGEERERPQDYTWN